MPWSFWLKYLLSLATVTLALGALYALTRRLARHRGSHGGSGRIADVLESTMLSQHASIHVVKIGSRRVLIGAGNAAVSTLAEIGDEAGAP